MKQFIALIVAGIVLVACDEVPQTAGTESTPKATAASVPSTQSARTFARVVKQVEPVAERECRSRTTGSNCDFRIFIDDRPGRPANAYQTLDPSGRPAIGFTLKLIAEARNADELAFILGHEAAHHINGHIERTVQNAQAGAVIFAGLATLSGGDAQAVRKATELGAQVGARTYSKEFELEADALGTVITHKAGFDPVNGAKFFARIPDPGDKFLGTHPPNAARVEIVRKTAAGL